MFISLGPNCHTAGSLKKLNLRGEALPFDWMLCEGDRRFEYLNDLINTNFSNFTTNLSYNHRSIVISKIMTTLNFFIII